MTQSIEVSNLIYIIFHVPPGVSRIQSTKMGELVKVIPRYQINRKAVILQIHYFDEFRGRERDCTDTSLGLA